MTSLWDYVVCAIYLVMLLCTRIPKGYPPASLVSNFLLSARFWTKRRLLRRVVLEAGERYGPLFTFNQGGLLQVLVNSHHAVKEVLAHRSTQGRRNSPIFKFLFKNKGGVLTNERSWQRNKKLFVKMLRTFGFGRSSTEAIAVEEALKLASFLKDRASHVTKDGVSMEHLFYVPVLNTTWQIAIGSRFDYDNPWLLKLIQLTGKCEDSVCNSFLSLNAQPALQHVAPEYVGYTCATRMRDTFWSYMKDVLEEHSRTFQKEYVRDFIDYLLKERLENGITFTDEDISDVCMDLYLGGTLTSGSLLSFAFLYMMLHPDIQNKVQQELDDVIGKDHLPSIADLDRLPYTSATLLEVQRIVDVFPIIPRCVVEDADIFGYRIQKGTMMWVNTYSVHMDKGYWKDPEAFRPERFLYEGRMTNKDRILTFGAGRRRCPGESHSKMIVFLFFTIILQKYTFSIPPSHRSPPSTEPIDGLVMRAKPFQAVIKERV